MLLEGRVVIVAGAGPGLGSALATGLVGHGARVVVTARSEARIGRLGASLGDAGIAVPADLTTPDGASTVVRTALAEFDRIDGLVYNAAAFPSHVPVTATPRPELEEVMGVNVIGPAQLVRAAQPSLMSGASIVFIGSAVVRHPKPGFGAYNIGKHALLGLARSLALELGPAGVRVNTVAAGKIDGERLRDYFVELADKRGVPASVISDEYTGRIALGRVPTPAEYCDVAAFLLSDLARAVTGHTLDVNGGEYFH